MLPSRSKTAVFALALVLVAGCAATASKLAVPYQAGFHATDDLNPDNDGRPSPIQITLYELRSSGAFQGADYFSLQNEPQQTLGEELIAIQRLTLRPGQEHELKRPGHVDARVLGVVAGYRDLDGSRWRQVIDLPESRNTNIYKFWQFSPGATRIDFSVGQDGIYIVDTKK